MQIAEQQGEIPVIWEPADFEITKCYSNSSQQRHIIMEIHGYIHASSSQRAGTRLSHPRGPWVKSRDHLRLRMYYGIILKA